MATFLYTPGVEINIHTARHGTLDVTHDLVRGDLTRTENQVARMSFSLLNPARMYDRVFMPNDRISVKMKRINWVQVFSGYLDTVPLFSARARTISLEASCTLKRLKYRYWDAGLTKSVQFIRDAATDPNAQDGGMKARIMALLWGIDENQPGPGGWDKGAIHISAVPPDWFERVHSLYEEVRPMITASMGHIGAGATIGGVDQGGATASPTGTLTTPQLVTLAKSVGLDANGAAIAAAVARAESGGKVDSIGGPNKNGTSDYGLWQINTVHTKKWNKDQLTSDANYNAQAMAAISSGGKNWKPWSSYNAGKHEKFMAEARAAASGAAVAIGVAPPPAKPSGIVLTPVSATPGKNSKDYSWGGHSNGQIPPASLQSIGTGSLHKSAAGPWLQMQAHAAREGIKLSPSSALDAYRPYSTQVSLKASKGSWAATPGKSVHGWGFACDFNLGGGGYASPVYKWLAKNGPTYGWIQPSWAVQKGSKPEPWHWEYVGPVDASTMAGQLEAGGLGTSPGALLNTFEWAGEVDPESDRLAGVRALMNDEPLMSTIETFVAASQRSFSSAPNGDFIAWFPDYFGVFGYAAKMVISDMELTEDFSIAWSDDHLITHQYTLGAPSGFNEANMPGGRIEQVEWYTTSGIASVEFPPIMAALMGVKMGSPEYAALMNDPFWKNLIDGTAIMQRYGARPDRVPMNLILHEPETEFWYALHLLQQNWARQFTARVDITFMPELYPGMLIQLPSFGFQAYVVSVSHSFSFEEGSGGFTTSIVISSPSSMEGKEGLAGLQKAGAGAW